MERLQFFLVYVLLSCSNIFGETIVGIDLGTTYCSVAAFRNGRVEIIPNGEGNRITPSYVAFTAEGERLIGDEAKAQITNNPENTIYNVKRLIGRTWDDKLVQHDIPLCSFKVVNVENKPLIGIKLNNRIELFTPVMITAMLLERMKEIAEEYLEEEVTSAVITTPAYFNEDQRQATKDAGQLAGLKVKRILSEPTAAAMSYSFLSMKGQKNILVFDIGGGTFDVSIIEREEGHFRVIATKGDTNLGGEDFNQRLLKYLIQQFKKKTSENISRNQHAIQKLRSEVERVKRRLSFHHEAIIDIPNLYKGNNFTVSITRTTFEELNEDLFRSTMNMVYDVIKDSGLYKEDIDDIVLVGGSSRIIKIQELLEKFFRWKMLRRDIHPEEAVAYGAAVQAAVLMNEKDAKEIVLLDTYPFSLGYEVNNGTMKTMIPRNTNIPFENDVVTTTAKDNQDNVEIKVYRGEYNRTNANTLLAKLVLYGIPPAPQGVPKIKVKFEIDVNGILNVIAEELATKRHAEIVIDNTYDQLTDTELAEMRVKMYTFRYNELAIKDRTRAKENLEKLVYSVQHFIEKKKKWLTRNHNPTTYELSQQKFDFDVFLGTLYQVKADSQIADKHDLEDTVNAIERYVKQKLDWLDTYTIANTDQFNLEKRQLDEYLKVLSGATRAQVRKRHGEL